MKKRTLFNTYEIKTDHIVDGDDKFWIAKYPDFNACIGQGRTKRKAIKECKKNLKALIAFYNERNIPLPIPKYSSEDGAALLIEAVLDITKNKEDQNDL